MGALSAAESHLRFRQPNMAELLQSKRLEYAPAQGNSQNPTIVKWKFGMGIERQDNLHAKGLPVDDLGLQLSISWEFTGIPSHLLKKLFQCWFLRYL
jgi:hypothetical protein